ncbi:phage antirepressor N-terminal domain-containing protein [Psychrobacter sp. I-STPA10]|uniref:phage antirepressor N-terminal domain-containing protein n=1 Tax=Psychrobacter sp. I-STPA10 TaxID=2585769 RepID=UPI001E3F7D1A|nr:phage antirepressor N-terminal domain-containing protein [Psychrobacter sp. I-STPA10]
MNSISVLHETITIPFHGQNLFLVNHDGEPYTPMKPIVENMGLNWASQYTKIKQRFSSTIVEIAIVAQDGKERLMTCLPVRKLAGWLYTISPNKVKSELREKVIIYQEECDDVLWRYWTNEQRTDSKQRECLITACDRLAVGNTLRSDVYTMVANHFGYERVTQIPTPLLPEAVAFVYDVILARQKGSTNQDYHNSLRLLGLSKVEDINHAVGVAKKQLCQFEHVLKALDCAIEVIHTHNGTNGSVFKSLEYELIGNNK